MGLDTFTYITSLDPDNPLGSDLKSVGDQHLRGVKKAVQDSFPAISGAVTATHTELNYTDGVTSAIQAQIDGKAASSHGTHVTANGIGASELNVTGNGTSGQYLGSDGDGTMTWTSISSDPTMGGDISGTASNAQVKANVIGANELNVTGNGTSGQYLGSDADGTFTWTSISADPTMGGDISGTASNAQIVANAVTATEIVDGAVTEAKLASGVGFPSGTSMVFRQTSAPTGWTKSTAHNDKAIRVVSGSVSAGGTHGLSSPPSLAHTHTGPSHTHTSAGHTHSGPSHTHSTPSHSHSHSLSAGAHTLSTSQMPSHNHLWSYGGYGSSGKAPTGGLVGDNPPAYTDNTGGGSSHSHSLSGSITSGGSGTSGSASGTTGSTTPGATGASGTGATGSTTPTAFAPLYMDMILAIKD